MFVSNLDIPTMSVIDVSAPDKPSLIATLEAPDSTDVQVKGDFLYVNGDNLFQDAFNAPGIRIFDVKDPANPRLVRKVGKEAGNIGLAACHNLWLP